MGEFDVSVRGFKVARLPIDKTDADSARSSKRLLSITNDEVITVRQLKEFLSDWPEYDVDGEEFEVWIGDASCKSVKAKMVIRLNKADLLIEVDKLFTLTNTHQD